MTARNALASLDAAASLALLLDSPVVDVAVPASGALFNMALSLAGAERIRQQGLTATLLGGSGLRHADGRVRANAAGVLQNVAAHLDEARAQLAAEGALAALLDLVASESALGTADGVHVIARALGALSNCALLEANVRALCGLLAPGVQGGGEAGAKGGLGALLHILGAVQREDVLEDASSLLVRILTVSEPARAELVSLDGLSAVQRLMGSADEELQIRGCQLLRLCAASEPRAHAYALASALAPALVELFAAASEEVQEAAVRAATALCERPAFGAALRKADGISALVELLASRDEELIAACLCAQHPAPRLASARTAGRAHLLPPPCARPQLLPRPARAHRRPVARAHPRRRRRRGDRAPAVARLGARGGCRGARGAVCGAE